ncbi:DUF2799 domain-containing protein [Shewanella sp. 202IG2-18]|uniref:DUF2799 domain-containing protein n=1 Tax=Parashewanella hymeniacidonis TaxID=2807618 RepID=UPI001960ACE0|nr:DUF2799 domain-containing protein [Parashewanella hymeniacidonis]MBM7073613.1 DUF2799 domain-containing protein [Parashewanella hymeniacidonis]
MKRLLSLSIICLILSGCQTISPEECKSADWYNRGINDGSDGLKRSILQSYTQECAEAGISVNSEEWRRGYKFGLQSYCTAENGYFVGSKGLSYNGVCHNREFLENYKLGNKEYQLEQKRQSIRNEINQLQDKLHNETDKSKRKELRKKIERLEDRLDSLYTHDT